MAQIALDISRDLLVSNVFPQWYIGQTKDSCQLVNLSFDLGYITWIMLSVDSGYKVPRDIKSEVPYYFSDFYTFQSFIAEINSVCRTYVTCFMTLERIQSVRDIVNAHFSHYQFLKPTDEDLRISKILGRERSSYVDFRHEQKRIHPLVKVSSFIEYLRSQLALGNNEKEIAVIETCCNKFLVNCGIINTKTSLLDLTDEALKAGLYEFDVLYESKWKSVLRDNCQKQDLNEFAVSRVYAAIKLGERTGIPYAAAYKVLTQKNLELDPKYMAEQMRIARLDRFK